VTNCLRYLDWAAARLAPRRPLLLLTSGLSGSGKTWLARRLAPALGALHLRSDVERKRLAGLEPLADSRSPPDGGIYTLRFNERTYERLRQCADAALEAGESLVVDAAFLRRDERASFLDLARGRGAHALIVHCHAPEELLRRRVAGRSAARDDASEAGLEVLARQPDWWEDFDDRERAFVLPADTARPDVADTLLEAVRARLAS
jgi:predicted kinase